MSRDSFKAFVDTNRVEFETRGQDFQDIWGNIENELDSNRGSGISRWMRVAAAVLVLALAGWSVVSYQMGDQMPNEVQEAEQHYFRLINVKMEQLSVHHKSVDAMIWEDLEMLDQEYDLLKNDLKERADQEEVAQAMIENQMAKLEILDQILNEIESKSDQKNAEKLDI
jgi:hypothetical protein